MKLFIRAKVIGPIGLVLVTAGGCTAAAPDETPVPAVSEALETAATTEKDTSSEGEAEQQREPYGPVAHIADALSKVGLSDEQREEVEKLGKDVTAKEAPVVEARRALTSALTEQLKEGTIDERALESDIDRLVKAREEASPALRKAVETLHGILDEKQRGAFVDALRSRMNDLRRGSQGWFDEFAKDLGLSEDQKSRAREVIEKAKAPLDDENKTTEALFDAFKGENFSIQGIVPISEVGKRTRARAKGMIGVAKELTGILTPEQRTELAKKLESKRSAETERGANQAVFDGQLRGEARQAVVVRGGGYRTGVVRSWGGGYTARSTTVRAGYAAGYPLVGGYGMGVW